MRLLINFFFCFALTTSVVAQTIPDFNNYQPIKCVGLIPEDFRTLSQDKFKNDVKTEAKEAKNHNVSSSKEEFLLETNYIIDQLLLSGKVLFGDTVTEYVNKVADRVLVNQPELRGKLRFYCLRSSEANAFSTNQGIVFVTLGLIAQLENEAQLAYVLSHEIAHYERHHTMNEYIRNEQIFSKNDQYKYSNSDDQIRAASSYSKELELEADSIGLIRLSKTGYDCDAALSSMFVLQFSELPFEDFEFNASILENPVMVLPKDLFLDTVQKINLDNDKEDDTYSTHPNVAARRKKLEIILDDLTGCGNQDFTMSAKTFFFIRKICRFETVRILVNERDYVAAFYNTYVLQKEDSTSNYLRLCMGKSLYGIAKYKNHDQYSDVSDFYGKKEGNQQQCYYLFQKASAVQMNMIALRYLYNLSKTDSSFFVTSMRNDLADEAVRLNDVHFEDMKKTYALYLEIKNAPVVDTTKAKVIDTVKVAVQTDDADSKVYVSKYDKLRKEKKKQDLTQAVETKKSDASKFYLLAFGDVMDNASVKAMFDLAEERTTTKNAADKLVQDKRDKMSSYELRKEEQYGANEMRKKGMSLGIDTVVYVDPFYVMADDHKGIKFIQSETEQLEFCNQITENAGYAKLSIDVLNPKTFGANDVEKYNDLSILNDWIGERVAHEDEMEMVPMETDRMIPLMKKYNTSHFCYTGIYTVKQKREDRGFIIFFSIICYPILPFGIAYALSPEYNTYYYTLMYDANTGKPDVSREVHIKSKSKKGFINSIMYDMMVQIKREKKTTTVTR